MKCSINACVVQNEMFYYSVLKIKEKHEILFLLLLKIDGKIRHLLHTITITINKIQHYILLYLNYFCGNIAQYVNKNFDTLRLLSENVFKKGYILERVR